MIIKELKVSNYKCLDNYSNEEKIVFDGLNVPIGENDSGKTSLLDLMQIIFGYKKINKHVFFKSGKPIKIKLLLDEINQFLKVLLQSKSGT